MQFNIFKNAKDARAFAAGDVIFREGDPGDVMYAVVEGTVNVILDGEVVQQLSECEIFGEMALVDDGPRAATAVATSPVRLAVVDKNRFTFLVQEHPTFALHVMREMVERLRRLDSRLAAEHDSH